MTESQTQIGDMRYNAAEQRFEALVTFHTDSCGLLAGRRQSVGATARWL